MIRLTVIALALTVSGCGMIPLRMSDNRATPAPMPATLTPKERLVAAIAANGCVLTADNVSVILSQSQVPQADVRALTNELAAEGRAEVSAAGTIRVLTDTCI